MIPKVNRLTLLRTGSGPGQGNSFPAEESPRPDTGEKEGKSQNGDEVPPASAGSHLSVVVSVEQAGMTEVVKDLLEQKQNEEPVLTPALGLRYSVDASSAKGLLLNRKAE